MGPRLWLRWSWTDLRRRWLQVLAIGAVLGMGAGLYTAFGSLGAWRQASYDASFGQLKAHDLRLSLTEGGVVREGDLVALVSALDDPGVVTAADERLVMPTQIDASTDGATVLTPGRIVGADSDAVDILHIERGRAVEPADDAWSAVVLEANYGEYHDLPPAGTLRLAGGRAVPYTGQGRAPDYLVVTAEGVAIGGEANLGVVFTSLATAQRLAGRPGAVNELVVRLAPGASASQVGADLQRAFEERLPGVGATVTRRDQEEAHVLLYRDAKNDQRVYDVIALLLLFGAALAAFTLAGRVVEAQRREIGIGMAMGVPARLLAVRPLLTGAQIAVLGAVLGVGVGLITGAALTAVLQDIQPLPVLLTDFQPSIFVRGALIALAVPVVATLYPVWRGVRVWPVEAIRIGARAAGSGLAPALRRLPLPGRTLARMGPRNVLRTPRRTALTALGVAAVVCALVAISGMLDSYAATVTRAEADTVRGAPSRLEVQLDDFRPVDGAVVRGVDAASTVGASEAGVRMGGIMAGAGEPIDVTVEMVAPDAELWSPAAEEGEVPRRAGEILIARAAAEDLGVGPGDEIMLSHPRRRGPGVYDLVQERVRVSGIHGNPLRFLAYMHPSAAGAFGVAGLANTVSVVPAPGSDGDDVKRQLFGAPGVVSTVEATAAVDAARELIAAVDAVLQVAIVAALILAVLIAFNASSINADERRREHATMLAFGVPLRHIAGASVVESALIGLLGTIVGILLGRLTLGWIVDVLFADTMPDLGTITSLSAQSIAMAVAVGVVAVGLAPLFVSRGIGRTDVPSALRTME
jgi:putative ABC transport system permease protein